jgi:rfaE bifunctional protein nucleotidyltransferase chain/domain
MKSNFDPGKKIISIEGLKKIREENKDKTIVFTVGCYDVIHRGHIFYLNQCAQLGDILVVGIAKDSTVKLLKGPERPINPEVNRLHTIAALHDVDFALLDEEMAGTGRASEYLETKVDFKALLENLQPDIFVIGQDTVASDTKSEMCKKLGISLKVINEKIFSENEVLSTSNIIKKIRSF